MTSSFGHELLAAKTDLQLDAAFETVLESVNAARESGDLVDCQRLLGWVGLPNVVSQLHVEVFLSCLRLTFGLRAFLSNWNLALDAAELELERRGEDVGALLCGLKGAGL